MKLLAKMKHLAMLTRADSEGVRADGKPQKPFIDDEDSSTEETPLI